jgi:hypothetical protein
MTTPIGGSSSLPSLTSAFNKRSLITTTVIPPTVITVRKPPCHVRLLPCRIEAIRSVSGVVQHIVLTTEVLRISSTYTVLNRECSVISRADALLGPLGVWRYLIASISTEVVSVGIAFPQLAVTNLVVHTDIRQRRCYSKSTYLFTPQYERYR